MPRKKKEISAFEFLRAEDVFYWDKKRQVLVCGDEEIHPQAALKLVLDAKKIFQSDVWKKLVRAMIFEVSKKMYLTDMNEGKWMLATVKLFEDKVINLVKLEKTLQKHNE